MERWHGMSSRNDQLGGGGVKKRPHQWEITWSRICLVCLNCTGSASWSLLCFQAVFFVPLILLRYLRSFGCAAAPTVRSSWDSRMSSSCAAVAWFSKCPETFIETVFECHPLKHSLSPTPAGPLLPNLSPFLTRHLSTILLDKPSLSAKK